MRTADTVLTMIVLLTWDLPAGLAPEPVGPPLLKVDGKQLKTPEGKVVRLQGLNIPSLEWGQGEHLLQSLGVAIDDWGVNVIRLPLSQDRWFGHGKEKKDGGAAYRKTVREFVGQAAGRRCYVILDLHWSNTGTWGENIGQHNMPDDKSAEFWGQLAAAFANHPAVLFDLYNEPHGVSWEVWRNGGKVVETDKKAPTGKHEYETPGLQKLLDVCRSQGAKNIVVAGGLDWAYDLTGIVKGHALNDPTGNGPIWAYDTVQRQVTWTPDTATPGAWDVTVATFGTYRAFANPITGAPWKGAGLMAGEIQYVVTAPAPPSAANLPAVSPNTLRSQGIVDELFGQPNGSTAVTMTGGAYNFVYEGIPGAPGGLYFQH